MRTSNKCSAPEISLIIINALVLLKMKEETEMHFMMKPSQNSSRPYCNPLKIDIALQYYNMITMPKMALEYNAFTLHWVKSWIDMVILLVKRIVIQRNVHIHFIIFLYKYFHIIGQEIYSGIENNIWYRCSLSLLRFMI